MMRFRKYKRRAGLVPAILAVAALGNAVTFASDVKGATTASGPVAGLLPDKSGTGDQTVLTQREAVPCCVPGEGLIYTDVGECTALGGEQVLGPLGDRNGNGIDDACEMDDPCEKCGPGINWLAGCLGGTGLMYTEARVGIDLDLDCIADTTLTMAGPTYVDRSDPIGGLVDTEITAMELIGGGGILIAGGGGGSGGGLPPSYGQMDEGLPDDGWVESFFDVFFEVQGGALPGPAYNQTPLNMSAPIDCVPPSATFLSNPQNCLPLFASPEPIPGQEPIANIIFVEHITPVQLVACCLPDYSCIVTTQEDCTAMLGWVVPACLGDPNGNGMDDACEPTPPDYHATPPFDPLFPDEGTFIEFGIGSVAALPPDFFGPGSDPFEGQVALVGNPIDPGTLGNTSTILQRSGDPVLPDDPVGTDGTVEIELVALNLVSIDPITVTYNGGQDPEEWNVRIELSSAPVPTGFLTATKTHPNGGTYDITVFVHVLMTFTQVGGSAVVALDTGDDPTVQPPPPWALSSSEGTFVHRVDSFFDVFYDPGAQWVAGIEETIPGDTGSQVARKLVVVPPEEPAPIIHGVIPPTPPQVCEPDAAQQTCIHDCPDPSEICEMIQVARDPTGLGWLVQACDCLPPDACHVTFDPADPGADPYCVGVCPPGESCNLVGTDTNGDQIDDLFECVCGPVVGACCYMDLVNVAMVCVETTAADCATRPFGIYQGDGTQCGPIGSCCYDNDSDGIDESCQVVAEICCDDVNGTFTAGGVCDPKGACCVDASGDGVIDTCIEMAEDCCILANGSYHGDGTNCTGAEACCFGDGSCQLFDPFCCTDLGGAPWGAGTTCDPNPCPQATEACCMPDGLCMDVTPAQCSAQGGIPQGPGSYCQNAFCQACCLPDATCIMTGNNHCAFQGGDPQGLGSLCANVVCDLIKWSQPPLYNPDSEHTECFWGWNAQSIYEIGPIAADDWLCTDERPITDIHWWGSYVGWTGIEPPLFDAPELFHIAIWTNVDGPPFSRPDMVIWEWYVPRVELNERPVACDFYPGFPLDGCFKYDFKVPPGQEFMQGPASTVFWISIAAIYPTQPPQQFPWGWKTREPFFADFAVWIFNPLMPIPGMFWMDGHPIMGGGWDLAFVLTTRSLVGDPKEPPYPHHWRKNRYISFDPNKADNGSTNIAFKIELTGINQGSCSGADSPPCRFQQGFGLNEPGDDDCRRCSVDNQPCIQAAIDCIPSTQACNLSGETCSNDDPIAGIGTNLGLIRWVGPENNGRFLAVTEAFREERVGNLWPDVIHVGDCEIVAQADYAVRTVDVASGAESNALSIETQLRPANGVYAWWCDCVGPLGGFCNYGDTRSSSCAPEDPGACGGDPAQCKLAWTPPDGYTNFDDINATTRLFGSSGGAQMAPRPPGVPPDPQVPDITWVDVHGDNGGPATTDPPQGVANFSDIALQVLAFQGRPYPFHDPADCPDAPDWP